MAEISQRQEKERPEIEKGPQIGSFMLQRGRNEKIIANVYAVPDALDVDDDRLFVVTNHEGTEEIPLDIREKAMAETIFLGKPQSETIEELERLRGTTSQNISPRRRFPSVRRKR